MSQWTHVAGLIRIDSMMELIGPGIDTTEALLRERLGYTWNYDDIGNRVKDIHIDKSHVPSGSEGSIQYDIVKTRVKSAEGMSLSWGYIVIHGDLRGFDNPNEIYEWLFNALDSINEDGIGFREVVVLVAVEYVGRHLIVLDNETDKIVMLTHEDD